MHGLAALAGDRFRPYDPKIARPPPGGPVRLDPRDSDPSIPIRFRSRPPMLLVIDNYDSFTYNLVQYLGELGAETEVWRNDRITTAGIRERSPDRIVISPGPCTPDEAGVSLDVIRDLGAEFPILGVCLGHQCIGQAYGGRVLRAPEIMHGKTSLVHHRGEGVFRGLPDPFVATRYHSLIVERDTLPACLEEVAWTENPRLVMGLRHRELPVHGVQFHPESILTEAGKSLLRNFLEIPSPRAVASARGAAA